MNKKKKNREQDNLPHYHTLLFFPLHHPLFILPQTHHHVHPPFFYVNSHLFWEKSQIIQKNKINCKLFFNENNISYFKSDTFW